jgi:hypothetical protein
MSSGTIPIHERLNQAKIGNRRTPIRRTRSKSLDHLPAIDPIANAKITKQLEHIQEAYKASPPVCSVQKKSHSLSRISSSDPCPFLKTSLFANPESFLNQLKEICGTMIVF